MQTWAKEVTRSPQLFRVSFGKGKSPQMRNSRFQRAMLWVFLLLMMCSSGEATFSREVLDMLHPWGGRTHQISKIASWPPTRKGSLQNGQKLQLSCINTFVLEKGLQGLWCHHLSLPKTWGYVVNPCSALLCSGVSTPAHHGGQTCGEVF